MEASIGRPKKRKGAGPDQPSKTDPIVKFFAHMSYLIKGCGAK